MLASELIEEVRDNGDITPDTLDATILRAADAEIRTRLLPMLRTINEEYLVRVLDVVAINGRVALPPRATGAAVRLVQLITGTQLSDPLPRLDPARASGNSSSSGQPFGFYLDGGGIVLVPRSSNATLRIHYYARPGKLVLENDDNSTKGISSVVPGPITTTLVIAGGYMGPTTVDIVAGGPAHQHKAISITMTGAPSTWTVPTTELLEEPTGGVDCIVKPDFSPFVPLPEELGSTLALRTAAKVLANLGYKEEAAAQYGMAETAQEEAWALLRPRADGNPKQLAGGVLARMGSNGVFPWRGW
ncbi:MAG: hypothetical protein Q8K32_11050 [Archangium sp.]|nr:hypothetical protein [Archangium sp.]